MTRDEFIKVCMDELAQRDYISEMSDSYSVTKAEKQATASIRYFIKKMEEKTNEVQRTESE